jgi:hypothetical protein
MDRVCTIRLEVESNREFSCAFLLHFPHPIPFFFGPSSEFAGFGVSGKEGTSEQGSKHARFLL